MYNGCLSFSFSSNFFLFFYFLEKIGGFYDAMILVCLDGWWVGGVARVVVGKGGGVGLEIILRENPGRGLKKVDHTIPRCFFSLPHYYLLSFGLVGGTGFFFCYFFFLSCLFYFTGDFFPPLCLLFERMDYNKLFFSFTISIFFVAVVCRRLS